MLTRFLGLLRTPLLAVTSSILISGCSIDSGDDSVTAQDDLSIMGAEEPLEPFFRQFIGSWESPCLFEPEHLMGPTTGDYVVYTMTVTNSDITFNFQDYLDEACMEIWPYGSGGDQQTYRLNEQLTTESGLAAAVLPRSDSVTIIESITGDPTPGDNSSGGGENSSVTGFRPFLDIMYRSDSGQLFLGDLSSTDNDESPPTRLNLDSPWTSIDLE